MTRNRLPISEMTKDEWQTLLADVRARPEAWRRARTCSAQHVQPLPTEQAVDACLEADTRAKRTERALYAPVRYPHTTTLLAECFRAEAQSCSLRLRHK